MARAGFTSAEAGSRLRDVLLVGLTVSVGALDAVSWLGLGKVYSAFQTGNIVILGFGTAGATGPPVMRALTSLVAFAIGAFAASRLVRGDAPGAIWPRPVTRVLGGVAVVEAAFLAVWLAVGGHPSDHSADALIALGALACGMQTGAVFSLGVRAVFTTAATATWTALMADLAGASHAAPDRRRLCAVLVALFGGAALGGLLMVHARELAPVLPLALTASVTATAGLALGARPVRKINPQVVPGVDVRGATGV
ncbi:MAG: hypothetical protein JWQ18_2419 [Conexibacter sp.]|nr:hypothetical protein [Conexibacter sp.]